MTGVLPPSCHACRLVVDGTVPSYASATATGGDFMIRRCKLPNDHPATLWRAGFALNDSLQVGRLDGSAGRW